MELDDLVGEWTNESVSNGKVVATGRSTFEWDDGVLHQRSETTVADDAPQVWHDNAPTSTHAVFGVDDEHGEITMLYFDSRGVGRVYRSAFEGDTWLIWRDAEGFNQRYRGVLSPDGDTIAGAYERSDDGVTWEKDFDATYTRVSRPEPATAPRSAGGA